MASRTTANSKHLRERPRPPHAAPPAVPAAALLSFLKETRELTSWTTRELAKTLKVSISDATQALAILQIQGYVKPAHSELHPAKDSKRPPKPRSEDEWITTPQGEEVSGSKLPRYTWQTIAHSLDSFADHLKRVNGDGPAEYKIAKAVAFGDFLSRRPRVQAADVGIRLEPRSQSQQQQDSAAEQTRRKAFLKQLRGRTPLLNLHPYAEWMSLRTNRDLMASRRLPRRLPEPPEP